MSHTRVVVDRDFEDKQIREDSKTGELGTHLDDGV